MWLVNITHRVLVLLFVSPMVHELVGAGGLVGAARGAKNTPLIQEEPARKRGPISTGLFLLHFLHFWHRNYFGPFLSIFPSTPIALSNFFLFLRSEFIRISINSC
jgi:hypothetical protein